MMAEKPRIFVFVGHPRASSLSKSLADSYIRGATKSGANIRQQYLNDMHFDNDLTDGYHKRKELEPCLKKWRANVDWATHIALFYPVWWGTMPSKMKGVLDRVLLPGYGFKFHEGKALPEKLLKGRTADVLVTADTPRTYARLVYGDAGFFNMTRQILGFCGLKTRRYRHFSIVRTASADRIQGWIAQSFRDGKTAGAHVGKGTNKKK